MLGSFKLMMIALEIIDNPWEDRELLSIIKTSTTIFVKGH